MKQLLALIVGILIVVVAAWVLLFNPSTSTKQNNSLTQDQALSNQKPSQSDAFTKADNGEGGVWAQVTLVTEKNSQNVSNKPEKFNADRQIAFYVALNTHSVDLSTYKLEKMAVLTTTSGNKLKPLSWESEGAGHHISGFLIFDRFVSGKDLLKEPKLHLNLGKIADKTRQFSWRQ